MKKELEKYLIQNGRSENLVDIYNKFPYQGNSLSNKQKGDRVRSIWRKLKRKDKVFEKQPKILIFDLETAPLKAYIWKIWKENINPINGQLQSQNFILSWSAKWLYDNKIYSHYLHPEEIYSEDDSRIVKELHNLVNDADIIIAHNCKNFDEKVMNTRFLLNDLSPTSHYQIIDTLLHARKKFRLESNKLDYLGKVLNLGRKINTGGFELWEECMKGNPEAMSAMVNYCEGDVLLLEEIYLKLRPWIKPHPNVNLITNDESKCCPVCKSKNITSNGTYTTYANQYKAYQCNSCKSTFRARKANKIDKTNTLIITP